MRSPNPPKILLDGLNPDQQRKVIRLALEVVYELGKGNEWGAFEMFDFAELSNEEKLAFASCLNSRQGAVIAALAEASYRASGIL